MPSDDIPADEIEPRHAVLVDALQRKGASDIACPVCNRATLKLAHESFFVQAVTPGGEIAFSGPTAEGFEAAAMLCQHCGYLRFHHITNLVRD